MTNLRPPGLRPESLDTDDAATSSSKRDRAGLPVTSHSRLTSRSPRGEATLKAGHVCFSVCLPGLQTRSPGHGRLGAERSVSLPWELVVVVCGGCGGDGGVGGGGGGGGVRGPNSTGTLFSISQRRTMRVDINANSSTRTPGFRSYNYNTTCSVFRHRSPVW